jgi:AraC-like DNA-binding protein
MDDTVVMKETPLFSSFECHTNTTERPEFPGLPHWHYFAEILKVRTGSLNVRRGNKSYTLSAGDAIFINPLSPHSLDYAEPGAPAEYSVIRFDPELLSNPSSYTPDLRAMLLEAERRGLSMVLTADELVERNLGLMIDACIWEYTGRDFGYDMRIRSLLFLICTDAVRRWIADGFAPQDYGSAIDPIYTLPSYIARHIEEPLKVEKLAEYCGLSYPWFARRFHDIYGISCKEFIVRVRIRRVEHYLQFTDCDLNYISQHTGYADCSHLVRDFRRFRNTTPGQFRQAYRQKAPGPGQFAQNY